MANLEELLAAATAASSLSVVERSNVDVGGVDPLGLRQINFDLMDKVLPGLNNVAEKLRPFVLMTWAWRRVRVIIERDQLGGATDEQMRDFVDRIEAIFAWSQFLNDPGARIPGGQALAALIYGDDDSYEFGGKAWEKRRDLRRSSTGLISPLNYGPGLRSMGWLIPAGAAGVFQPNPKLEDMLDSFETAFGDELEHPAFNKLGDVSVDRVDARRWGALWDLADLTQAEQLAGFDRLAGADADKFRREGLSMLEAVIVSDGAKRDEVSEIRRVMAEPPETWLKSADLFPRADAWRRLQFRQLLRLSLEALFFWLLRELNDGPHDTRTLADRFTAGAGGDASQSVERWLEKAGDKNPVAVLDGLNSVLGSRDWTIVPNHIVAALHCCFSAGAGEQWDKGEAFDRLPMARALREVEQWKGLPLVEFVEKMIEVWVIAQHAYWCVGRGLADARGRGKTLLRLRIVMDEGGWSLTPGAQTGGVPVPTPDRLNTAFSLLRECGRI